MSNIELKIIGFTNPNECLTKNTYNNMSAYVRFLHLDNTKTRLVVQSMNDRHTLNGSSNFIINNFMKFYRSPNSNRVDGNVFITLNTFNMFMADYRDKVRKEKYNKDHDISTPVENPKTAPYKERSERCFYGMDNIMIDIDFHRVEGNNFADEAETVTEEAEATETTNVYEDFVDTEMYDNNENKKFRESRSKAQQDYIEGIEKLFIDALLNYCQNEEIPFPNAYSCTGTGGVHLYYCISHITKEYFNQLTGIKYILAEKIENFVNDFNDTYEVAYKVDRNVFDSLRMDRMPGTMNPKTGRMCEFFKIEGVERYSLKKLLCFLVENDCDLSLIDWSKFVKKMQQRVFAKNKDKIIMSDFMKKEKSQAKSIQNKNRKDKWTKDSFIPVAEKRIKGLFYLAEQHYDFKAAGARELACFIMRNCCMTAKYDKDKEEELVHKFNDMLDEPLSEEEVDVNTVCRRVYRLKNVSIAEKLGMSVTDKLFIEAFGEIRLPVEKKYGFNPTTVKNIENHKTVAEYMLEHPNCTIAQTCKDTGISTDCVKKIRSFFKTYPELQQPAVNTPFDDFRFWSVYVDKIQAKAGRARKRDDNGNIIVKSDNTQDNSEKGCKSEPVKKNSELANECCSTKIKAIAGMTRKGIEVVISNDTLTPPALTCQNVKDELYFSKKATATYKIAKKELAPISDKNRNKHASGKKIDKALSACSIWLDYLMFTNVLKGDCFMWTTIYRPVLLGLLHLAPATAADLVRRNWRYSADFNANTIYKYELPDYNELPDIITEAVFVATIEKFPESRRVYGVYYNPFSLFTEIFAGINKKLNVNSVLYKEYVKIFGAYCCYYEQMRQLKSALQYQRNVYNYAVSQFAIGTANDCVKCAKKIIKDILDLDDKCRTYFHNLTKDFETEEFRNLDLDYCNKHCMDVYSNGNCKAIHTAVKKNNQSHMLSIIAETRRLDDDVTKLIELSVSGMAQGIF